MSKASTHMAWPVRIGTVLAIAFASPATLAAQTNAPAGHVTDVVPVRPEVSRLADAPAATMGMKLEKTIFKVDVLALTIRVDRRTASRIADAIAGFDRYEREVEPAVVEIARAPTEAVAEIEFLRNVRLSQFLDGVGDDLERAVQASWIEPEVAARLGQSLPVWFGFLEERRIRRGDRLAYHIVGDSLRTVFWGAEEGAVLLDQTDVGSENVAALLGAYFAAGSSFRRDLVESLWRGWDPSNP